ncbi:cellulose synthase-like protein E6 isoform X1 [Prosopis cineraria]|uniref:cellulose synthase-like protein E6 isoform X1 n=1 Tax=Prosopis cineraria TaxID=364024 RepID=UPI00240FD9BC|nr:cellulose synthase-like protein E6 isoform X1 [Prosopis cineraria]
MMWSEMCFGVFWILTQSLRWTILHHSPFKHILSRRYGEEELPGVDIFVCTADPKLEPPSMVMNTLLSAMSYNYPANKLSVYLSDDGGSELTFYALLRASLFSKHWIPFCRRFNIQPRSPEAYFSQNSGASHQNHPKFSSIKKLYEDMKSEIDTVVEKGKVPDAVRSQHRGFSEWNAKATKQNHHPIVQIIIDGRDTNAVDDDGFPLPTLVYVAREKRPNVPHHFKAGAMNALIRVSSEISNGAIILNLDCDMYPSSADTIQEALCFFMDETRGHQIAYVQFPQSFNNLTKNDFLSNSFAVAAQIELAGLCGHGGTLYCGTGCFHRRESLSGTHFKDYRKAKWDTKPKTEDKRTADELIEASKALASCAYEKGTQWGREMGLIYGIPAEDVVTGLVISSRGWKSIYYNPERKAFMGLAPTTLDVLLVQHRRWGHGLSQVFFSKYCPFIYGHGKISLGFQMGYSTYLLWAPLSLPTLCYLILLPISTFHGIPLFPQLTSLWILPFLYAFLANNAYSFLEALSSGCTAKAWWNLQRMTLFRKTTAYLFGFMDTISNNLNLSQMKFDVTDKAVSKETLDCYEREVLYFGSSSVMFTIMATLALLNLFGAVWGFKRLLEGSWSHLGLQIVLCVLIVVLNKPVYEALFIRTDRGSLPSEVLFKSVALASLGCFLAPLIC